MIKKIGCIEIPVSDMKRSVTFYEGLLGLKKSYEHPVWTSFDIEGIMFALAVSGTKKGKKGDLCKSCSPCLLRLSGKLKDVPTVVSVIYLAVENIDETYRELKNKGVEFIAGPKTQGWGGRTAVMLDPDKNIIVLTQYE
ncbi:MAG: VOC family protein [Thermoplasmatales archaeon]|nr:VOC family protein [Thermoplasmatales archaeon]